MGWTKWRILADRKNWYFEEFDWDGPACYELSIAGPKGGSRKIVYVGETKNERKRMSSYGRTGSHLGKIIHSHLKDGWILWYRSQAKETKDAAINLQNNLLARHDYDWNIQRNS